MASVKLERIISPLPGAAKRRSCWKADNFPIVTLGDVVNTQARLLDYLGVGSLVAAIGGSVGGVCAMEFAQRYPERVRAVIPIGAGAKATTLQKLHNFEQIIAIEEDRDFNYGNYYDPPRANNGAL